MPHRQLKCSAKEVTQMPFLLMSHWLELVTWPPKPVEQEVQSCASTEGTDQKYLVAGLRAIYFHYKMSSILLVKGC